MIFPCKIPDFSMFYKKYSCMHQGNMQKFHASSSKEIIANLPQNETEIVRFLETFNI